jgi:hypothetical protein
MVLTSEIQNLETYARLKKAGITPYWRVHHGVALSVDENTCT